MDLHAEYLELYNGVFKSVAFQLENYIRSCLHGIDRIDRVSARAKSPESFVVKASKMVDGKPKYAHPLREVQDVVGARVVVFYKPDVEVVSDMILRYFRHIESRDVLPESESEFGYSGKHLVLCLPDETFPPGANKDNIPDFFELQVKTLWQHAWSESNHDIGYKSSSILSGDQNRRLAFTAAQAWGADRIFEELYAELVRSNDDSAS